MFDILLYIDIFLVALVNLDVQIHLSMPKVM